MIFAWIFLIAMIVINLASNWLAWGDQAMQGFFQFFSLLAVALVSFGLGMGYRAEKEEDYHRPPTIRRK